MAIEYAYRTRDQAPSTWVFWVHASNAARFRQSFQEIADYLKISGRRDQKADILQLVHDWLRDERRKWLLVLDNVDDAGFLFENDHAASTEQLRSAAGNVSRRLLSYLPCSQNGSFLFTTRSKDAALQLVEARCITTVEPMDQADAQALLNRKLSAQVDRDGVGELAAALEFMPLAIVQAAAYIDQLAPRCSVRQYLDRFQKSDSDRAALLGFEGGQLRRDTDAKNSVIIAWHISFNYIRRVRPSAADLLALMSFFDRQGIPEKLLWTRTERRKFYTSRKQRTGVGDLKRLFRRKTSLDECEMREDEVSETVKFENDLLLLRHFAFVSADITQKTLEMHRLVQLAMRLWLEAHGQKERWEAQFLRNLNAIFPSWRYENWATCEVLFPHAKFAAAHEPENSNSLKTWADILYLAAWYAVEVGNLIEAESMSYAAMTANKKVWGLEHDNTLRSMVQVADAWTSRGRWEAAEELCLQVTETCRTKTRADHTLTATSIALLARLHQGQGRWGVAEELQTQLLETHRKKLGAEHPYTLKAMSNLALIYSDQKRWDEAEALQTQVVETRRTKQTPGHADTLVSMYNLATTYRNQGRWSEAEELQTQVFKSFEKKLGPEHPLTLTSMHSLACIFNDQGRKHEAVSLMRDCVRCRERVLGNSHPYYRNSPAPLAALEAELAELAEETP